MTAAAEAFAPLSGLSADDVDEGTLHVATLPNGTRLCVGRHDGHSALRSMIADPLNARPALPTPTPYRTARSESKT